MLPWSLFQFMQKFTVKFTVKMWPNLQVRNLQICRYDRNSTIQILKLQRQKFFVTWNYFTRTFLSQFRPKLISINRIQQMAISFSNLFVISFSNLFCDFIFELILQYHFRTNFTISFSNATNGISILNNLARSFPD